MSHLDRIIDEIDDKLTPSEQAKLFDHLSSKVGTKNIQSKALTDALGAEQSPEMPTETFCGIEFDKLSDTQKDLFRNKLSPTQREGLTQKVSINVAENQIEFLQLKEAIQTKDSAKTIGESSIDEAVEKIGNGWRLPESYCDMIQQMPGEDNAKKTEFFKLLTGMNSRYWTKSGSGIEIFNQQTPTPIDKTKGHLRLVRDI